MKKRIKAFILIMVMLISSSFSSFRSDAATTGWHHDKTGWWYVTSTSGSYVKNQWKQIGGVWYFFKSTGYMAANEYVNGYWLNKDGSWTYKYKAAWKKNSIGWWFGDSSGYYAKNTNFKINDVVYHFDKKGYNKAEWVKRNNKWSYIKANATYTVGLSSIDGAKYYFDSNGYMLTGWQTINGKKYYFISDGRMNTKSELTISGTTYLFDSNGVCKGKKEPVHQHTMKEEIIEPTCTTDGYTRHYCTTCDYSYNTDTIKAHHDIVIDKAVPATCTVPGKTQGEHCTKCDYKVKQKKIPALNHDFTGVVRYYSDVECLNELSSADLKCDKDYYTQTKCSRCDETEVVKHEAGTHTGIKQSTSEASTCEKKGHDDYKCSVCGYEWSDELELAEHTYGEWSVKTVATCSKKGKEHSFCSVCGDEDIRATKKDPNNHNYKINKVYVELDGDTYVATTCDPTIETYWEEECEWCHDIRKNTVEHLDHDFNSERKYYEDEACTIEAPEQLDCETTYYYKTKCINCDTWSDVKVKEAGQHNWIDDTSKEDIKSTCHTHGTHYKKCSICGKQDADELELDPKNHEGIEISDNNAVAATCKDKGKTASTHCSVCGNTIKSQIDTPIDPKNHIGELVIDEAVTATCQHTGLKEGSHWNCCGKVEVEQEETGIDPNNHEHTSKAPDIFEYYMIIDGKRVDDTIQNFQDVTNSKYYRYHGTNNNLEIEPGWGMHWWIYDNKENKYYVEDYESYGTTNIDVSWYWWKNFGKILDPKDYTTWLIPENPLIIEQAKLEETTPEQLVEKFTDYMKNPITLHSYPYNTIRTVGCQDRNSADFVTALCQPASTGNGQAWIYKETCYQVQIHTAYCKDEGIRYETSREEPKKLWDAETVVGYTKEYR